MKKINLHRIAWNKNKIIIPREKRICLTCGIEFSVKVNSKRKYCSTFCFHKFPKSIEIKNKLSLKVKNKTFEERLGSKASETKRKISLGNLGKIMSNEAKQKMSLAKKGKSLTETHRKNISFASKNSKKLNLGRFQKNSISWIKGKTKKDYPNRNWGGIPIGTPNHNSNGYGKVGYRQDLSCFFRSKWEANFARILNYENIKWEYENPKTRIILDDCSYLPDFFLPEFNFYVEIKGYLKDKFLHIIPKLLAFKPNFPLKVIDYEVYKKLCILYKKKILSWEN